MKVLEAVLWSVVDVSRSYAVSCCSTEPIAETIVHDKEKEVPPCMMQECGMPIAMSQVTQ